MTEPHPQPQRCIHECVCHSYLDYQSDDLDPCLAKKCEHDTRTRTPAAPATEPEPKCDDCRFVKNCPLLYFPPCEQLARNDERHYREKAKAGREQVLNALEEFLNSDDHLSLFKWEVREQIRSLRGGAQ